MSPRVLSLLFAMLLLTSAVTASDVASSDSAPRPVPNGRVLTIGPLEADFARLEASIPGFAGWHFDADGTAVISLKHAQGREEAFARVASLIEARGDERRGIAVNAPGRYEAREARYSFLELAAYRAALYRHFPGGIRRVDVDEVRNVLALGLENADDVERIRASVRKAGIPAAAVRIDVVQPLRLRTSLQDYHRPLRGGSQFVFRGPNNVLSACTLGINGMYYGSSSYAGFVTASHCSQYPYQYTGNAAGQPTTGSADLVADEYDDPGPVAHMQGVCPVTVARSGGYPNTDGCRWSDSSFYRYRDSVRTAAWGGATIHTTSYSEYAQAGSVSITGSLPVTGDAPSSVVGTVLHKMGGSTGWTYGAVTQTCVDQFSQDYTVLFLCQDGSDLYNEGGDSGAPVYRKFDTYVQWAGILWSAVPEHDTWHSPAWNVRQDLPNFSY